MTDVPTFNPDPRLEIIAQESEINVRALSLEIFTDTANQRSTPDILRTSSQARELLRMTLIKLQVPQGTRAFTGIVDQRMPYTQELDEKLRAGIQLQPITGLSANDEDQLRRMVEKIAKKTGIPIEEGQDLKDVLRTILEKYYQTDQLSDDLELHDLMRLLLYALEGEGSIDIMRLPLDLETLLKRITKNASRGRANPLPEQRIFQLSEQKILDIAIETCVQVLDIGEDSKERQALQQVTTRTPREHAHNRNNVIICIWDAVEKVVAIQLTAPELYQYLDEHLEEPDFIDAMQTILYEQSGGTNTLEHLIDIITARMKLNEAEEGIAEVAEHIREDRRNPDNQAGPPEGTEDRRRG